MRLLTSSPKLILCAALTVGALLGTASTASDWPRFRGPNGSGVAEISNLPTEFSVETADWTVPVVFGRSSPIVAGGLVYLTGLDDDELVTLAIDASTGEMRWKRGVPRRRTDTVSSETGPAVATPVSDGQNVFAFFPEFGIVSYDRGGRERWRHELPPLRSYYGLASSPILEDGVLILLCDQTRAPYLLGLDAGTGKVLWKHERSVQAESWTTPVVHRSGTPDARVLTFGTFLTEAYVPRTGAVAWSLPGVGPTPVASPVVAEDRLFVLAPDQVEESAPPSYESFASLDDDFDGALSKSEIAPSPWASAFDWFDSDGDGSAALVEIRAALDVMASSDYGLVGIDLSGAGRPEVLWSQKRTLPYVSTPILYDGVLFLIKDGGILTSYEPNTGKVIKRGRVQGAIEGFSPSPVATDGKLYLTSNTGKIAVIRAEGQWSTLAVNDLDEVIHGTPALAEGRMFVRTRSKLLSFAAEAAQSSKN